MFFEYEHPRSKQKVPTSTPSTNGSAATYRMTTTNLKLPVCTNIAAVLRLTLNVEVSVGGNLSVALLDGDSGTAVAGFGFDDCLPIGGNRLGAPVRFAASDDDLRPAVAAAANRTLKLDFRLRPPARIFAWRFHCGE